MLQRSQSPWPQPQRRSQQARVLLVAAAVLAGACGAGGRARQASPAMTAPTTSAAAPATTAPPLATTTSSLAHTAPAAAVVGPVPPGSWVPGPWQPAGRPAALGGTAVETTTLRAGTSSTVVGVARLDTSRLRVALYAGVGQPAGAWSNEAAVAPSLWPMLVATFNSGFKLDASRGGWYLDGRPGVPLRDGAASVVILRDGSATIGQWGRDARLGPDVVAVRQNLNLMVDAGQPAPGLSAGILPTWGYTLGGVITTWRSALGVDGAGRLLYVAGSTLDPANLASALVAAGAVRAMELDINPAFVSFTAFADGPGAGAPTKLLANMVPAPSHFLAPVSRDFFAVFTR